MVAKDWDLSEVRRKYSGGELVKAGNPFHMTISGNLKYPPQVDDVLPGPYVIVAVERPTSAQGDDAQWDIEAVTLVERPDKA